MLLKNPPPAVILETSPAFPKHHRDKGSSMLHPVNIPPYTSRILSTFMLILFFLSFHQGSYALDLDSVVEGFRQRYEAIETVTGNYQHHYRAPAQGIEQTESGVFWFKRPGFMRWECRHPEEKLYILDGHQSFHYIPLDYQVYVQPLTVADLRSTPLELLLGTVDIHKKYEVSWEVNFLADSEQTCLIRLTSRERQPGYSFMVLELDEETWELRRLIILETNGNISEFLFSNTKTNMKINNSKFRFKPPKGVDVIQITDDE